MDKIEEIIIEHTTYALLVMLNIILIFLILSYVLQPRTDKQKDNCEMHINSCSCTYLRGEEK